jgi:inorganic pyrophosphatase
MKYIAIIEIPKNSNRRIHKSNQFENFGEFIDFGPISDKISANGGHMPLAYGFIQDTIGGDGEGDEVDVMIFSMNEFKTADSVEVIPFATMVREDGDYKILAHDETVSINSWEEVPVDIQKILMDFNGFKLPILSIKDSHETLTYLESMKKSI